MFLPFSCLYGLSWSQLACGVGVRIEGTWLEREVRGLASQMLWGSLAVMLILAVLGPEVLAFSAAFTLVLVSFL